MKTIKLFLIVILFASACNSCKENKPSEPLHVKIENFPDVGRVCITIRDSGSFYWNFSKNVAIKRDYDSGWLELWVQPDTLVIHDTIRLRGMTVRGDHVDGDKVINIGRDNNSPITINQ